MLTPSVHAHAHSRKHLLVVCSARSRARPLPASLAVRSVHLFVSLLTLGCRRCRSCSRVLPCDFNVRERASRGREQPPPAPSSAAAVARAALAIPCPSSSSPPAGVCDVAFLFHHCPRSVCSARCRRPLGTRRKEAGGR